MTGKIIIITGCNTGIGRETAKKLAELGGTIIFACRDVKRSENVVKDFQEKFGKDKIDFIRLDLSDLNQVREFV